MKVLHCTQLSQQYTCRQIEPEPEPEPEPHRRDPPRPRTKPVWQPQSCSLQQQAASSKRPARSYGTVIVQDSDSMADHEELFLQPESSAPTGETPRPLRINKHHQQQQQQSPPTHAQQSDPAQQWASYRVPPSSAAAYGAPTSPPPSGPLPYPDDRHRRQPTPGAAQSGRIPSRTGTPQELAEEGRGAGPPQQRAGSMSSDGSGHTGRARFAPNDPNRPTVGGYGSSPPPLHSSKLAERRGTPAKNIVPPDSPGGPEPPHKSDEDDGLFQVKPQRERKPSAQGPTPAPTTASTTEDYQQFYPPPLGAAPSASAAAAAAQAQNRMHIPDPAGINRLSSTASNATTRASRGSPPPPETPIDAPASGLSGIEARYAASGIPGTSTLNEMQAQSAAAAARRAQYASPQPQRGTPQPQAQSSGRWSPTEQPGSAPHGPPIAFQGTEEVASRGDAVPSQSRQPSYPRPPQPSTSPNLEGGMNNMNLNEEPPPAYSPPAAGSAHSQYPNEKGRYAQTASPNAAAGAEGVRRPTDPNARGHPAFANDSHQGAGSPQPGSSSQQNGASQGMAPINVAQANQPYQQTQSPQPGPASPPPLPEGWIAHLDNNSGQYYYIHLPTQSTQWEFPKGPTPLNLQEPTSPVAGVASPVGSVFKQPLQSPGYPVQQMANYDRQSMLSMNSLASPTASGFTGPPPSAGVDMYKIQPSNGVYLGPYLRYTNMDLERGLWLGSILLITDAATQPPTIHIHQSMDLSPNPRQLKAHPIHSHQRWIFYRYDVDLKMDEAGPAKWTYAITSHLGCTRYEFLVAGRHETSWRFVAHSGNDFAINVSANDRSKLGGVPLMWKDVLLKHQECGGFHAQIGLGGQIYADRLWKDIAALKQWTQISGKENRKTAQWTAKMEEDVTHAYFHYYTSHFDQPAVKEAFAQIPHVCCLDDHDIFDGYGSYPEYMQESHVFKNLGRIGIEMYLLFQHHTTHEILRNVSNDIDLFTITGKGWHFVKYLGPSVVIVGPDTRSERGERQVMAGPTYQGLFPKVATLPPSVQHCIWLLPVPIIYPRLESVEQVASTVATGKRAVTGGFNMLGKVAGGFAGVVGAKGAVNSGFDGIKKAVGKSGLMSGVLSPFGNIDMLDELRDLWTHESKVSHNFLTHNPFRLHTYNVSRTSNAPTSSAPSKASRTTNPCA